jgi:hypothetical protein
LNFVHPEPQILVRISVWTTILLKRKTLVKRIDTILLFPPVNPPTHLIWYDVSESRRYDLAKKNKHQSNAARKKQIQRQTDAKTRDAQQQALSHGHYIKNPRVI